MKNSKIILFRKPDGGIVCDHVVGYGESIKCNDKIINSGSYTNIFVIDDPIVEFSKLRKSSYIEKYVKFDGSDISIEEYLNIKETLVSKSRYYADVINYNEDDISFENPVDKVAWVTFKASYTPVYNTKIESVPIDYEIVDLPLPSEKYPSYIDVSWKDSDKLTNMCIAHVKPFLIDNIIKFVNQYNDVLDSTKEQGFGKERAGFYNLKFWRINNNYIKGFEKYETASLFRGSLIECENKLDELYNQLKQRFVTEINKNKIPLNYADIITDLTYVLTDVKTIECKQKSNYIYNSTIAKLNKLIKKYEDICNSNE